MERCAASARRAPLASLACRTATTGQNSTTQPSLHRNLVANSPDETLQAVAAQCNHSAAPGLLCSGCMTTRDARAARNPNLESSR